MDNIFFSVIMPNYNNEKYLDKSINSILKQDFKNFEFIFIFPIIYYILIIRFFF